MNQPQESFSVRCLFRHDNGVYEERVTLWRAASIGDAIALAEEEAESYARDVDAEVLGLAQAYGPVTDDADNGTEVFSLLRKSTLDPDSYLTTFFDTGTERQRHL
jgi:hypothetical protein